MMLKSLSKANKKNGTDYYSIVKKLWDQQTVVRNQNTGSQIMTIIIKYWPTFQH